MTYRNVVWDMGGTMFDTYPAIDALFAAEVADAGGRVSTEEVARLTRVSTHRAVRVLAERFEVTVEQLEAAYARLKERWRTAPPPVMAGLSDVLDRVRSVGGLNLVVTHRDRASATDLLRATGLDVDDMVCVTDGFARKPEPQMYDVMARRHRLDPASCLAIGDRAIDAEGARAAGMGTMFLRTPGLATPDELVSDHVADQLVEALPLIG